MVEGALARLGHSLACVKIWGRSIPWLKYGLLKKLTWVGTIPTLDLCG